MLLNAVAELIAAPNPAPVAPPGAEGLGNDIISWFKWVAIIAGVVGLIACGIMMSIGRRNRSAMAADGASGVPWVVGGIMTTSLAAVVVGAIL